LTGHRDIADALSDGYRLKLVGRAEEHQPWHTLGKDVPGLTNNDRFGTGSPDEPEYLP
jgi:hypothetical protein